MATMLKISKALDLSVNYLCGDLQYKDDEKDLIRNYRNTSDRGKAVIRLFAQVESQMTAAERNSDKYIIPCLIPIGVVRDGINYKSCDSVKIKTDNPDAYLAIEITTNYFAPSFCAGDRILLENRFPKPREYAVFMTAGRAYFRQYLESDSGYILRCINGRGNDMTLQRMDTVYCIGTLVGLIRA